MITRVVLKEQARKVFGKRLTKSVLEEQTRKLFGKRLN